MASVLDEDEVPNASTIEGWMAGIGMPNEMQRTALWRLSTGRIPYGGWDDTDPDATTEPHPPEVLLKRLKKVRAAGAPPSVQRRIWEQAMRGKACVERVVGRYLGISPDLEREDLLQYAYLGLLRAAEYYDPRREDDFERFATWQCRQVIRQNLNTARHLNWIPAHSDSLDEIVWASKCGDATGGRFVFRVETMPDNNADQAEEILIDTGDLWKHIGRLYTRGTFDEDDLEILEAEYGLAGEDPQTHSQIAQKIGRGRSTVSALSAMHRKLLLESYRQDPEPEPSCQPNAERAA